MSDQGEDVSTLWSHFDLSLSQHYPEFDRTIISKEAPIFYSKFKIFIIKVVLDLL